MLEKQLWKLRADHTKEEGIFFDEESQPQIRLDKIGLIQTALNDWNSSSTEFSKFFFSETQQTQHV